jgi:hypothetical protein
LASLLQLLFAFYTERTNQQCGRARNKPNRNPILKYLYRDSSALPLQPLSIHLTHASTRRCLLHVDVGFVLGAQVLVYVAADLSAPCG